MNGMILAAAKLGMAATFAVSGMIGLAGHSQAEPSSVDSHGHPSTIALSDLEAEFGNADSLPQCDVEDCSDQPGQFGLWLSKSTGNWYLSVGEASYLVIDDSVQWRAEHNLAPNA